MLKYTGYLDDMSNIRAHLEKYHHEDTDAYSAQLFLVAAGETACRSLNFLLQEASFWTRIQKQEAARKNTGKPDVFDPAAFKDILVPFDKQLLAKLNYTGPPPAHQLVSDAVTAIQTVQNNNNDSKLDVRTKVELLAMEVCGLTEVLRSSRYVSEQTETLKKEKRSGLKKIGMVGERLLAVVANAAQVLGFAGIMLLPMHADPDAKTLPETAASSPKTEVSKTPDKEQQLEEVAGIYFIKGLQPQPPPVAGNGQSEVTEPPNAQKVGNPTLKAVQEEAKKNRDKYRLK